ncbi:hypothetical protein NSQ77_10750 [Oceanobacillus sp. FSL K6-2867]
MNKDTDQTTKAENAGNIEIISSLIYKAISIKLLSEQNEERE